jgi:predicted short-subunit dehydrogenase-like oxidoreductase (DUF2520 family)
MSGKSSAKLPAKPRIAVVGAGNLAGSLALCLHRAGYRIDQIVSRNSSASLRRARRLAREVGAPAMRADRVKLQAEIVWFCVPDGAIASAAKSLAGTTDWKGRVAFHSSGALTSDELEALRKRGAAVASVHPMMTFVRGSRPTLMGVPFAIEGDQKSVRAAWAIVLGLGGQAFSIQKRHKEAYHAWGMFASPLLTALLATTERVAAGAGIHAKAARQKMLPILAQTVANYAALGAGASFSGPIVRGDADTVKRHLRMLRKVPAAREAYVALARAALRELPAKNRIALRKILSG